jgi:hypothetical protein
VTIIPVDDTPVCDFQILHDDRSLLIVCSVFVPEEVLRRVCTARPDRQRVSDDAALWFTEHQTVPVKVAGKTKGTTRTVWEPRTTTVKSVRCDREPDNLSRRHYAYRAADTLGLVAPTVRAVEVAAAL